MPVTLTQDMTWQLGDSGFTLNTDIVPGAPFVDVEAVTGLASAPYRETKKDHEGVDGGFLDAEFETGRDLLITGTLYSNGNPIESVLDLLKSQWAPSRTLVPLYYTTNATLGTRVLFVKPRGLIYDIDLLIRTGTTAIQFGAYAEQSHIFDTQQTSALMNVGATIFTGFAFPLSFSFGFGGVSTTSDGQIFTNNGNRPTPVVFTITGPVTNPVIYSDENGVNMAFAINLASTDQLVIDTYYRTVRLNGSNRRAFMTTAGWFHLLPGANTLRFRAAAGTGTLLVQYRSAWR